MSDPLVAILMGSANDETDLEPVRLKKGAPDGFLIHRYSVEVHGLCSRCARQAR